MRILAFFFACFLAVSPAFAAEPEPAEIPESQVVEPYATFEILQLPEGTRIVTDTPPDEDVLDVQISTFAADPVTPSNSNGLKQILLSILGDYSAIQVEMRYTNSNGTYSYQREIQPDYVWIASAACFLLCLWSCFRLVGVFFCRR